MKKIFHKFFKGYCTLEEADSPINGRIRVWEDFGGSRRLMVGGLTQSGKRVERLWKRAFDGFKIYDSRFKNCLILGLGGGSVVLLINRLYSDAKVVGVEIDPEMIRLGQKYFGLDKVKNLKIEIADAIKFINHKSSIISKACCFTINHQFDLVLVDLYLGSKVPEGADSFKFLQNIRKLLKKDGIVIFNRLYYGGKREKTDKFEQKLTRFFDDIEAKKIDGNKLFLCQRDGTNDIF